LELCFGGQDEFMEIFKGFLLGAANNFICIGVCSPVLLSYLLSQDKKPYLPILEFLGGRLLAYLVFAFGSGFLGIYFEGRIDPLIFSIVMILLSGWLILFSIGKLGHNQVICKLSGKYFSGKYLPFFWGIVMGLNLCPPFLLGLSQALEMHSIFKPVIFFLGFYIGSSLWLVLLLFTDKLTKLHWVRLAGRLISFTIGLWYLGRGIFDLIHWIS
jgi:hypothetical protein